MNEINKENFGAFISTLRKEKNYTQKELAEKLLVSDKAVSKWERGLSMPDISLLIPLAQIFNVTVTELLEGKRSTSTTMEATEVEDVIKKTIYYSEQNQPEKHELNKKKIMIYGFSLLIFLLEVGILLLMNYKMEDIATNIGTTAILAIVFGIGFWWIIFEKLPTYYDENKISFVSNGFFRMNMVGLHFNNSNWKYVLWVGRIWSVVVLITSPLFFLILQSIDISYQMAAMIIYNLVFFMGSFFIPIYIVGKKYE